MAADGGDSEARYRQLFDTLIEGFCTIEMIFDASGKPVDYRFLEINPAFEKQTGLRNAQGKRMRELAPNHEAHWFEIYGNIALTGEPLRFENEAKALGRHYEVVRLPRGRAGEPQGRHPVQRHHRAQDRRRRKLQAQLERMSLLHQITRAIGERQDLPSIFQVVIRTLEDQLPIDFGCICLYDAAANESCWSTSVGAAQRRRWRWNWRSPSRQRVAHRRRTACRTACAASWSTSRT